jgi:hypothetical protein
MPAAEPLTNPPQAFFRGMLIGVLLYSVVIGFFNDYTDILHTGSYSVTFAVAIVMQVLTYLTFALKDFAVRWIRRRGGPHHKIGIAVSVWAIMFLSKFVFLAAISVIFQGSVEISGFVGLFVVILCMTAAQRLVELIDRKLGAEQPDPDRDVPGDGSGLPPTPAAA